MFYRVSLTVPSENGKNSADYAHEYSKSWVATLKSVIVADPLIVNQCVKMEEAS